MEKTTMSNLQGDRISKQASLQQNVTKLLAKKRRISRLIQRIYWIGFVPIWIGGLFWSIPRVEPQVWWNWLLCIPGDAFVLFIPYSLAFGACLWAYSTFPPASSELKVVREILIRLEDVEDIGMLLDI